ncbi:MAG: glycosyltransferase [Bacteroidota bacterium]|jgi:glycosyltransferase involved in cell wall biosynthesis
MIINVHIYPSSFKSATRILKETRSLLKLGLVDRIILVGILEDGLLEKEEMYPGIEVHRLKVKQIGSSINWVRYLGFMLFLIKAYWLIRNLKCSIINVHSLHVLLIGVLLKRKLKCKLVYDTHELETEVTGSSGILRYLSKILEKFCIKFVDEIIVVSKCIENWYSKKYNYSNITTIYNIPYRKSQQFINESQIKLRAKIGLKQDDLLFIYQGLFTKARGVDNILKAFSNMSEKFHVVFMGSGPYESEIIKACNNFSNIHYHPPVAPDEVLTYTREADIGIHIIKNTCLNHYFCLPNKIFEYLLAGIPFIVSNFPELTKLAKETGGGWTCEPEETSLRDLIRKLTLKDLNSKRDNIKKNISKFGWDLEELKYISIYQRLLTKKY